LGDKKGNWFGTRRVYKEYWIDKVLQKYILKYLKKNRKSRYMIIAISNV